MEKVWRFFEKPYLYLLVIFIGISFKISQIRQAFFWDDEVSTIFHVNGQDGSNFFQENEDETIHPSSFYTDQIFLSNKEDVTIATQLGRLALKPQYTPLHYPYLVFWYRIFGDAPMTYRYFSFFVFLLALITLFFLCKELFRSNIAAWIALSIFAISPYFHFFALTARYPMLFAFSLLLSHFTLLKALRTNTNKWWAIYTITLVHSLYVSFFSIFLLACHTLFILWKKRAYWKPYVFTSGLATLLYVPWIWLMWQNYDEMYQAMEWHKTANPLNIPQMIVGQFRSFRMVIIDLPNTLSLSDGLFFGEFRLNRLHGLLINAAGIALILWSFIYLYRKGKENPKGLILPLIVVGSLFLIWSDLFRGSFLSYFLRYHVFLNLGVLLLLVHLLYNKLNSKKVAFVPVLLSIITLSIVSIALQQGQRCLRIRGDCSSNIEAARLLENEGTKLFITDLNVGANASNALTILLETKAKDLDVMSVSSTSDVLRLIPENKYDKIYLFGRSLEIESPLKEELGDQMVLIFQRARFRFWELKF